MAMTREQQHTYLDDRLRPFIDRGGHAVQGVFDPATGAAWAYTVGLNPELVITGFVPDLAANVLNDVVDALAGTGRDAEPGVYDDLLSNAYKLTIREVRNHDTTRPLTFASVWRDDRWNFRAMQLVWPDDAHRFPWEPGYAADAFPQPLLPEV